jgi:S1-C subfamily serine protease
MTQDPQHVPVGRGTLQRFLMLERSRYSHRLLLLAAVFIVVVGVLAWLLWRQSGVQEDAVAELERLQDQLHAQEQAAADASGLRSKLAALEEKLAASGATADWAGLAKRYERGLFLCLGIDAPNSKVVLGTAFVADAAKGIIVTNAHVAIEVAHMPVTRYVQAGTGVSFEFEGVSVHPRWDNGKGPDLALIRLKPGTETLTALDLMPATQLVQMKPGIQVGSLGFPAELAARYLKAGADDQLSGALPTFKVGWIGRITALDGTRAEPIDAKLIQHSASLTKGTSGSPLFDAQGRVVAVSFAGLGSRSSSSGSEMSSAQIGFAIRADELRELIASTGW